VGWHETHNNTDREKLRCLKITLRLESLEREGAKGTGNPKAWTSRKARILLKLVFNWYVLIIPSSCDCHCYVCSYFVGFYMLLLCLSLLGLFLSV